MGNLTNNEFENLQIRVMVSGIFERVTVIRVSIDSTSGSSSFFGEMMWTEVSFLVVSHAVEKCASWIV